MMAEVTTTKDEGDAEGLRRQAITVVIVEEKICHRIKDDLR